MNIEKIRMLFDHGYELCREIDQARLTEIQLLEELQLIVKELLQTCDQD